MKSFLIRDFIINGIKGFFNRSVGHIPLFGAHNQSAAYSPINNYRFKYRPAAPFKEIALDSIPIFFGYNKSHFRLKAFAIFKW